jgi:ribonucleoside-diphosphate reductase alpha chain
MSKNQKLKNYFKGDELASSVWKGKYAIKGETTPDDMHKRMAKEFARIEAEYWKTEKSSSKELSAYGKKRSEEFFRTQGEIEFQEDRIYNLFKDFKYIIPQGSIMTTLGTNQIASLSNCWVIESPLDSYSGIHKTDGDLIYYYKRRGGVGMDISNLRPANTPTNNAAKSSTGAVSFMHRFSNTTREVGMNGRRAALMISIDINHPDVMDFIKIKRDGVSVTGANISIKLNNEFMKAVENDGDYFLRYPCDKDINISYVDGLTRENGVGFDENDYPKIYNKLIEVEDITYNHVYGEYKEYCKVKRIKAREYWNEIIKSAKNYAEPGLMYWDNIMNYDPASVYENYKPITSNPCGEQFLQANDSCRLMVHNLYSYVKNPFTVDASFDFELFYQNVYEGTRLGDDLIDLEVEYIQRIIDKIKSDPEPIDIKRQELELWEKSKEICLKGRRTGMGITALGDCLAALNIKYDSDEALAVINVIMDQKMEAELDCTIDLAILREPFEAWNNSLEYHEVSNDFYRFIRKSYPIQYERLYEYGRRNISWSTIAPCGSVSILTQTTSGCEPLFQPFYMRRKKINPNDKNTRVDFIDQSGDSWQEFFVLHPKFKDWIDFISKGSQDLENIEKNQLEDYFKSSPWYNSTANDIDWIKRVEIQSILQKYTTNAISSTINLPSTVTEEEVSNIYMEGWKRGLKGQTVYVDGSRSGVLVDINNKQKEITKFEYKDAIKRPRELNAHVHKGNNYKIIIGLLEDKPYEVFIDESDNKISGMGIIYKKSSGNYFFKKDDITTDISSNMTDEQAAITRLVSTSLRHGTDIKFIVEQLQKTNGDLFSFTKGLARVLKKYIPDGAKSTIKCDNCGSSNVIFEEGCNKCLECGYSKCG